ncbi:hypothetical protein KIN34_14680 [Cellulomonas sp. DKR-3]|uniref:Uncharacterized protein n=1 Tax=Cellulomonas fulva TaxID=2835530 RepID=A0ABS5U2A0_9CELL|nr:hypothetical protein [Cellulomonas fulva]MBT0995528.1 hypothetical protein [Cellulomonas fulva]
MIAQPSPARGAGHRADRHAFRDLPDASSIDTAFESRSALRRRRAANVSHTSPDTFGRMTPSARAPFPNWALNIEAGRFDPRVLHHEFWIDARACVRYVDELTTEQLHGIVGFLASRSLELYGAELVNALIRLYIARDTGTMSDEELAHHLGQRTIADLDHREWMETTALMRSIRRTLRSRD